jgi:hypothetical protein
MPEQKYAVFETNERLIADNMDLVDALLLCKAIMQEYYADTSLSVSIVRHEVGEDGDGE